MDEIIVIGGGLAGLSTAHYLASSGAVKRVTVVEREKKIGNHASGNNAGMIRQTVEDEFLMKLAIKGRSLLSRANKKGIPCGFRASGSLLLSDLEDARDLRKIQDLLKRQGARSVLFDMTAAVKKAPVLREGAFKWALFCPTDALVDVNVLLKSLLGNLKKLGVKLVFGAEIKSIGHTGEGFRVRTDHQIFKGDKIVNACGAWASSVGKIAGASDVPFKAYERHLFVSAPSKSFARSLPFVWHLTQGFYLRPWEEEKLLLSPCDKILFSLRNKHARKDKKKLAQATERDLQRKLRGFSKDLSGIRIDESRSGLRTMAPDGRFVIGEDPLLKNFYWVAGLGGHGVTTSLSVGDMASRLILKRPYDKDLLRAFSPKRFSKKMRERECFQK